MYASATERTGMAGKKRKSEWNVSEAEESVGAAVHGVVTQLSPVNVSKHNPTVRYFDGTMSDGRKSVGLCRSIPAFDRRWSLPIRKEVV